MALGSLNVPEMSTKLNVPSACLQKRIHNLHQSPTGAVTPERLGTLDGAGGEATDWEDTCLGEEEMGSRAQRKD